MSAVLATPPAKSPPALKRTPLFAVHERRKAHFVPFSGWEMPLYYRSIRAEHEAVRRAVGIFDVSHMGIFTALGSSAASLLSRRTTAKVDLLEPGQCRYTFLLDHTGAIFDDLLIVRMDPGGESIPGYLLVPNASRADRVFELLLQHRHPDTRLDRWNGRWAILAVQGPSSRDLLQSLLGWRLELLNFYEARLFSFGPKSQVAPEGRVGAIIPADLEHGIWVSRTGYTGELGFELFVQGTRAPALFDSLVEAGALPCGLGARDTLRLEKGYLLSGQDFNRDHTPIEAGQERFVSFDHPFVGREALEQQRKDGPRVRLIGLRVNQEGAIPRHGTPVLHSGALVGTVTSGGLSPTLHAGIALTYLPSALAAPGTEVSLDLRGRSVPAQVVRLPFVPATSGRL